MRPTRGVQPAAASAGWSWQRDGQGGTGRDAERGAQQLPARDPARERDGEAIESMLVHVVSPSAANGS